MHRMGVMFVPLLLLLTSAMVMNPPQRFEGTESTISQGQTLTIHYENSALAGENVTVDVVSLQYPDQNTTVQITLDANGKGTADFTPPSSWEVLRLEHSTSRDYTVAIGP